MITSISIPTPAKALPPSVPRATTPPPPLAEMSRLLARLSRKGAMLTLVRAGTGDRFRISLPGAAPRSDKDLFVEENLVSEALDAGWIARDRDVQRYRLTESGALALRGGIVAPASAAVAPQSRGARPEAPSPTGDLPPAVLRLQRLRDRSGRALIDGAQAEAAMRLQREFMRGQMLPRVTQDWGKVALGHRLDTAGGNHGAAITASASDAQERVRRLLAQAGPLLANMLVDVCCSELGFEQIERNRGWAAGSARVMLQTALEWLVRYYGTLDHARAGDNRVRQWGTADFRPTLDRWQQQRA